MNTLAILCVRNEAAFLIEWLAHHRAAGFSDVLVFSNDCQDGTDLMLDRLAELGLLEHHRNDGPYHQRGIQFTALDRAAKLDITKRADWILPLDIDEFVNVKTGQNRIQDLIAALPDATAITLTWRLFGNADIVAFEDRPVTETFTRCAPAIMYWPWRSAMFKTLYRNDGIYGKPGVHRPRAPDPDRIDQACWFDCEGRRLEDQFRTRRIFSTYGRPNYRLAQLNHYPLGAMESYVLKADRGRAVHGDHDLAMDYWVERNFNQDTDRSLSAQGEATALRQDWLADEVLGPLHQQAVAWRKRRFNELMQQEPVRALFARLLMTPPSRTINAAAAGRLRAFAMMDRNNAKQ